MSSMSSQSSHLGFLCDSGFNLLLFLLLSVSGDVGFVSLQPPEGRCRVFDKYSSDTCKAARGVRDFLRPTAARLRGRGMLSASAATRTHLNYRWIRPFSRETQESGWEACGRLCTYCGPPSTIFHRCSRQKKEEQRRTEARLPAGSVRLESRRSAVYCRLKKTPLPGDPTGEKRSEKSRARDETSGAAAPFRLRPLREERGEVGGSAFLWKGPQQRHPAVTR